MTLFESTVSDLDSASGSVLLSEALSAYTHSTRSIVKTIMGPRHPEAESKAEAVVSRRASVGFLELQVFLTKTRNLSFVQT